MKVSIVVPLLNEAESLPHLVTAVDAALAPIGHDWEIVFVDDGSTDDSYKVIGDLHTKYPSRITAVRFIRNYGKSAALSVGIEKAAGDVIITMDADLQDDPSAIPDMLKKLDEGWDLVSGWKKKRHDPVSKTLPSKCYNAITSLFSGIRLHDFNCGFKAYRSACAKSLEIYGERHRYLPTLAHWNRFRVTEMVVPHHARKYGRSKFGIGRATGMFDILTLLFLQKYMRKPLHFFGLIGALFIVSGTGVLGYFGVMWAITGSMHIRPLTLLSMGAVIMGIQFVSIGLIGEMITNASPKNNYQVRETLE